MSLSIIGSGRNCLSVGLRNPEDVSAVTPRATRSRARDCEIFADKASDWTTLCSASTSRHLRPDNDRMTLKAVAVGLKSELTLILQVTRAHMACLDPTHGPGSRTHNDTLGRDEVSRHVHTLEHRAVGDAR